ncbi:MAG: NADP-dependent malic enzyme [Thermoproteus sp.]
MADKWYQLSVEVHRRYGGKFATMPKVPVTSMDDFAIYYSPGVAEVSRRISGDPDLAFELTSRWNVIAVISDGTRVLGLGNVGPEAAYAVMEGKALIFKYLGGVDAVPLPIRARDADRFIEVVKAVEPAFGGINLEDIESPKCFRLLDQLSKELKIPVWHDDQQGTATATLAGLINATKLTGKDLRGSTIALVGAGASNIYTARLLMAYGVKPGNLILVDTRGILHPERDDVDRLMVENPWKYELALRTNAERRKGGIAEAMRGVDIVVAASRPGPGVIKKEWVAQMNKDPIVFALANPTPEIWPWEAKEAGAKIVATGRSDLPNQVNNSLVFPAVFRGLLDVRARTVVDQMLIAAAEELAKFVESRMSEEYILPKMTEWEVYPREAAAVAAKASELGLARRPLSYREELNIAQEIIGKSVKALEVLMESGLIPK